MDYKILKINDEKYPEKLRQIKNPPKKLYYIGNIDLLEKPIFAVIGTRNITEYGKKYGKIFSMELAKKFVIISGMAMGVDTIAHKSALEIGGETIAVLGSGFDNIFPKENVLLFKQIILNNGLIISEYSPNIIAKSSNFPKRNRIVSGLSDGVLIVEAGYRSGTTITARLAKEQGKNIFVIPGSLDNIYSVGANKLIQEGATLVTETRNITKHYPQLINKKWKKVSMNHQIKDEYLEIYEILKNKQMGIEELSIKLKNKNIREIANLLTMMEIEDLIIQEIGNGYKIKEI